MTNIKHAYNTEAARMWNSLPSKVTSRLVVLKTGLGRVVEYGLESISSGPGLEMKGLGLGLRLALFRFGLGLGPYWTCYKAHH